MSTLKLNKSPATADQKRQKPLRPLSPELRDRTKAPPKAQQPAEQRAKEAPAKESRTPDARKDRRTGARQEDGAQTRAHRRDKPFTDQNKSGKPARSEGRPSAGRPARNERLRDQERPYTARAAGRPASQPAQTDSDLQPRLSKVMADRGLCSRREADDWIVNGWVKVNGEIVETLGTRIDPDAEIVISTYAKEYQAENVTILLHKPVGYVSGQAEDGYEPAVVLVKPENQWAEDPTQKTFHRGFLHGLAPAGRLDIDSTGLLVLTQDGRIARHLIGEDSSTEKEYLVRVEGSLSANGLAKLNHGLSLDGVQLKPAKVSWQNEDQLRFVLREGRKRQIRRMCELVGLKVVGLKRIRIGRIALGKLPPGQWRYLAAHEMF